nr:unnamed protein product [Callosobruchus analis]
MGRKLRTLLPVSRAFLQPKYPTAGIEDKLRQSQARQAEYYNRSAKPLPVLSDNQRVLVQKGNREWQPGIIVGTGDHNDYTVKVNDGLYRRNRHFLRPPRDNMSSNYVPPASLAADEGKRISDRLDLINDTSYLEEKSPTPRRSLLRP